MIIQASENSVNKIRAALFTATRPIGVKMNRETSLRLAHEIGGNLLESAYPKVNLFGYRITFDGKKPDGAIEILYAKDNP